MTDRHLIRRHLAQQRQVVQIHARHSPRGADSRALRAAAAKGSQTAPAAALGHRIAHSRAHGRKGSGKVQAVRRPPPAWLPPLSTSAIDKHAYRCVPIARSSDQRCRHPSRHQRQSHGLRLAHSARSGTSVPALASKVARPELSQSSPDCGAVALDVELGVAEVSHQQCSDGLHRSLARCVARPGADAVYCRRRQLRDAMHRRPDRADRCRGCCAAQQCD